MKNCIRLILKPFKSIKPFRRSCVITTDTRIVYNIVIVKYKYNNIVVKTINKLYAEVSRTAFAEAAAVMDILNDVKEVKYVLANDWENNIDNQRTNFFSKSIKIMYSSVLLYNFEQQLFNNILGIQHAEAKKRWT